MATIDPLTGAKMVAAVGEAVSAAGDTPEGRAAKAEFGKAALTLAKTINLSLLPLAALNFGFEKARKYFEEKFPTDIAAKAASIPPEQIVEPKASIAGPALQGLAFSHEEPDLKDMYLRLLASAMDGRVAHTVHPAFVEIIRQLDADEARLLRHVLALRGGQPVAELRIRREPEAGWNVVLAPLAPLVQGDTELPAEEPRFPAMTDNWIRLGLITVDYKMHVSDEAAYLWVEFRPEYARLKSKYEAVNHVLVFERGVLRVTALGSLFANVVGITRVQPDMAVTGVSMQAFTDEMDDIDGGKA